MAYNDSIPQATDQLSVSQGDILLNFQALGAIAGNANAASASLNASSGFNWVYLPSQGATPPAGSAFPAGQIGLYSFISPDTTRRELYINKTNGVSVQQIPMTASSYAFDTTPASNVNGYTYLPSGLLVRWGKFTIARNTLSLVTMTGGHLFSATGLLNVLATQTFSAGPSVSDLNTAPCVGNFGNNTFQAYARANGSPTTGNVDVSYVAIGIPA